MEEHEFERLLALFPVVRSRDYCAEAESSSQSGSRSRKEELKEWQDAWGEGDAKETETQGAFWGKLRSAAEEKVGATEADKFCEAFRKVYQKIVYEELSKEVAQDFLSS